jgi:hypothetical protein
MDYNSAGSFAGREKAADAILKLDFDTVIPAARKTLPRCSWMNSAGLRRA